MLRSILGIAFTFVVSVPSIVYRARVEDGLFRRRFGEEWEKYAGEVGLLLPSSRKVKTNRERSEDYKFQERVTKKKRWLG